MRAKITVAGIGVLFGLGCESGGGVGAPPPVDIPPVCEAWFELSGAHTMENPPDMESCHAPGVWAFSVTPLASVPDNESSVAPLCTAAQVNFLMNYVVTVDEVDNGQGVVQTVSFQSDPDGSHTNGKVTQQGSACSGGFTHYTDDFRGVLNLKPYSDGTTISSSQGYFALYETPQAE